MKLLVQPADGVRPLLKAIASATRNIEIVIFRFEHREIERALANAVSRGVAVQALIAGTNRAGEESLRRLEMRLLSYGITVARTADDLVRYHGKLLIVDRRELYILAFNYTHTDIEHSRSFAIVTRRPVLVHEAAILFDADVKRLPYEPGSESLVVSPTNARKHLLKFIQGAKKELLIYDLKVSDGEMLRALEERAEAGVAIRLIGRITRKVPGVMVHRLAQLRLHTRTMIRDGKVGFVGSQSLRAIELDARREVGVIFRDPKAVSRIHHTFSSDWAQAEKAAGNLGEDETAAKVAKKVAKAVARELPPVAAVLNGAVRELVGEGVELDQDEIEEAVKDAVKTAVREVVSEVVEVAVEEESGRAR